MKLSIRLQNHGRKNHPLWWIVVAPNRKNIFGRFIEHVGYWSPRQGVFLQRQIVLNIPRIKYWMSCGAVPTFKVQRFLSLWSILPAPWYAKSKDILRLETEQQLAKSIPTGQQLTDKKKRKIESKQKIKMREVLSPKTYYKQQARYKFMKSWKKKIDDLKNTQERENQILRELLLYHEFKKIARINELSGKSTFTDTQEIKKLQRELNKAKAHLTLIKKNSPTTSAFQQTKTIKLINELIAQIRKSELQKTLNVASDLQKFEQGGQYLTEDVLKAKLEFELVAMKLQKNLEELEEFPKLDQPVLLQEYADFLVQKKKLDPEIAYIQAQQQFIQRGKQGCPLTKYDLLYQNQLPALNKNSGFHHREDGEDYDDNDHDDDLEDGNNQQFDENLKDANLQTILRTAIACGDCVLPTKRSVHPVPDLESYIPEDYYQPLSNHNYMLKLDDPLSPYSELQKYHEKKKKSSIVI